MLDQQGLFLSGPGTLSELGAVIERLATLRGGECSIQVRVVTVPDNVGGWQLFGGRLVLLDGAPAPSSVVTLDSLRLATSWMSATAASDPEQLRTLLLSWLEQLGLERANAVVQESFHVSRSASESADMPPSWRCNVFQHRGAPANGVHVDGPFVHEPLGLMARTVGELSAQWLSLQHLSGQTSVSSTITATLVDPRASLAAIEIIGDEIHLTIRSAEAAGSYRLLAFLTDTTRRCHQSLTQVLDQSVRVAIPEPLRAMELFLVDEKGTRLDDYYEDEQRCSREARVLYSVKTSAEADFQRALESGEGDQVEFKEWLPIERAKSKSAELFKTACAFANASGGVLFIGVADDLQLHNLDGNIRRALNDAAGSIEDLRMRYAQALLQLLRQGVAPNVQAEADWFTHAGLALLRVAIAPSLTRDHYVVEDRTSYVRRGASCAKATPFDLATVSLDLLGSQIQRRPRLGF